MDIVCLLFDGITALDIVGPYEVLQRLPEADVKFVAHATGAVRTDNGFLALVADHTLADVTRADVLVVPGGFATRGLETDTTLLEWIRAIDADHDVDDVGVHRLDVARGRRAARRARKRRRTGRRWTGSREYGAIPTSRRVVEQGKIITAAGVSSGIDMGLTLVARDRRRRVRAGRAARHRVRPAAAVRLRFGRQGARSRSSTCCTAMYAAESTRLTTLTITAEPWPNRPWLIDRPTRAPST